MGRLDSVYWRVVGEPLGTAMGITVGVPAMRLFFWMSLGIIICSFALTYVVELGLSGFEMLLNYGFAANLSIN